MSDLLKQAIADAKAVRATALANAKAALEEAFTPKLQSMLAAKLQQEVAEDDEAPVTDEVPVADAPVSDVSSEPSAECVPAQAATPDAEVPTDDEESMEEYKTLSAGHPDPVDITQHTADGQAPGEVRPGALEESDPGYPTKGADYKKATKGHKTVNDKADQNVAPNKSAKKTGEDTPGGVHGLRITDAPTVQSTSSDYKAGSDAKDVKDHSNKNPKTVNVYGKGIAPNVAPTSASNKDGDDTPGKALEENDVSDESLDEILRELESEVNGTDLTGDVHIGGDVPVNDKHSAPGGGGSIPKDTYGKDVPNDLDEEINLSELLETTAEDDEKSDEKSEKSNDGDQDDRGNKEPWMKENAQLKTELKEYRDAVKFLRDRINEVNLLNAKLLYTNKLFKQASLTNEQKMKVIESFDLTKSVREAKLVYATLSESFNFGAKKSVSVAAAPKKAVASTVSTITEGLASKTVASTKPTKEILSEGTEMASRFKKLAGIRK